jgi:hypothetical protein
MTSMSAALFLVGDGMNVGALVAVLVTVFIVVVLILVLRRRSS